MIDFNSEYFLNKFAPIPEKLWTIAQLTNFDGTKHCTIGWCGGYDSEETRALAKLFIKHFAKHIDDISFFEEIKETPGVIIYMVNDNDESYGITFNGSTPKARIMSTLYQIRKKELQEGNLKLVKHIISNPTLCRNEKKDTNKTRPRHLSSYS